MTNNGGNFAVGYKMQAFLVNQDELRPAVVENVSDFGRIQTCVDWCDDGASGKDAEVSIYTDPVN